MRTAELAQELGQGGAQELLRSATLCRLAYNGLDGSPRAVPVGFWWTGDAVVISTSDTAPKVAALRARPQVALTIDIGSPAQSLLIRGEADIEIVQGVVPEYMQSAAKSMSGEELAGFERNVRDMYPAMARISVVPSWARYFDFNAGRFPEFLTALAQRAGGR
jgi:Pyridoxamine 5'-phosphate oxidase